MGKWVRYNLIVLSLLVCFSSHAVEKAVVLNQLSRLISLSNDVKHQVHSQDEGRLHVLAQLAQQLLGSVETNGLGHSQTVQLNYQLLVRFQYSEHFFKFIQTRRNASEIREILALVTLLRSEFGFDELPHGHVLRSNIEQLHQSIVSLLATDATDESLRTNLAKLIPELANALALSRQGDRPTAFRATVSMHRKIKLMYPQLLKISGKKPSFEFVLEILGVNEFLGEFAQAEDLKDTQ